MGLLKDLDEHFEKMQDDFQHRRGQIDGSHGASPGTKGDFSSKKYREGYDAGRFDYEKEKFGEPWARAAKAEGDFARKISEKKAKPKEEEFTYRKEEPLFTCPECDEEYDGDYCYNCGYDAIYGDDDYYYDDSSGGSPDYSFQARDDNRSYTTRYKDSGKYPEETGITLPERTSAAFVFATICAFCAFIFIVFIWGVNIGEKTTNIGERIETEVFKKIWPAYETSAEKTERLKAEKEGRVRITKDLNRRLTKWIERSILPRYRKTEIDRAMPFHYFDYNSRGSHITAKVGVPFRIDGCFTYWGNFLCYSSNKGISWRVQWLNQDDYTSRALLKQKGKS